MQPPLVIEHSPLLTGHADNVGVGARRNLNVAMAALLAVTALLVQRLYVPLEIVVASLAPVPRATVRNVVLAVIGGVVLDWISLFGFFSFFFPSKPSLPVLAGKRSVYRFRPTPWNNALARH